MTAKEGMTRVPEHVKREDGGGFFYYKDIDRDPQHSNNIKY